jgi:hypothetical protein
MIALALRWICYAELCVEGGAEQNHVAAVRRGEAAIASDCISHMVRR